MRFEELQKHFDIPLHAFDLASLARMLTEGTQAIAEGSM